MRSGSLGKNILAFESLSYFLYLAALDKPFQLDFKNESKVLVLYTGGTIGTYIYILSLLAVHYMYQICSII